MGWPAHLPLVGGGGVSSLDKKKKKNKLFFGCLEKPLWNFFFVFN